MKNLANLLLIDDNPTEYVLAKALLRVDKVRVNISAIHDGGKAVQYLHSQNKLIDGVMPDLIFLDINLPAMNGREVLKAMKQDAELREIPVVMYSGSNANKDIEETRYLGAVSYMEKPLNLEKLIEVVNMLPQLKVEEEGELHCLYCEA